MRQTNKNDTTAELSKLPNRKLFEQTLKQSESFQGGNMPKTEEFTVRFYFKKKDYGSKESHRNQNVGYTQQRKADDDACQ